MKIHPPGTRIAQYEIASCPMMGGMGIVYICLDREADRPVALKTFRPEYLPDRAARDRFLREGTAWVDLGAHPHVVRCYRVLRTDPEVFLVLELVAKEQGHEDASLRSWLTPGQMLPVEQALLFALQIARGMAHAVERIPGFVHRDLKPENVLVGADQLSSAGVNRLRVTDFGLAAILQETSSHTGDMPLSDESSAIGDGRSATSDLFGRTQLTQGWVGTPLYMAPEQWRGEQVTVATDVYALGCILYEMLAGQRAVSGHSLTALQRAHCAGEVRPLPRDLPEGVCGLVTRCLAVEPGERYWGWEQVEVALVAAHEAVIGHPAPEAEPVAALSRAERVAVGWSYSAMGSSYLDIGKAEVALGYFERTREVGQAEGDRHLEAAGLNGLGCACVDLGDMQRAIGFYKQCLAIARKIEDRAAEGIALGNLGNAYYELGDARRAIGFHEQHLVIAREIGDRAGEGRALGNLGTVYADLDEPRRAIEFHEQQLAITRQIGNRRGEGAALGGLGVAYIGLHDAQRAIGFFEEALTIAREIGDRRGEAHALDYLGTAYTILGNTQRAIGFSEEALAIAREIGDRIEETCALYYLGEAYHRSGSTQRAIGFYEQALTIARQIGDRKQETHALSSLGAAYGDLGDARRAIGFSEKALAVAGQMGDRVLEGAASGNLGRAYNILGDAQRAIAFSEKALVIARETEDRTMEGKALSNLAVAYLSLSDAQGAVSLSEQALVIAQEIGDRAQEMAILGILGPTYVALGNMQRAVECYKQCFVIAREIGATELAAALRVAIADLLGK